jgi:DNA repair protein RadD
VHTLRPYQSRAVAMTLAAVAGSRTVRGKNPVLVAPTGSGKTVMGCAIVREYTSENKKVLWLAHRKELIEQAAATIAANAGLNFPPGIIMAGVPEFTMSSVQVASVQTLVRRNVPDVDLIIIDEAHHATADGYLNIIKQSKAPIVGLTATPFRLDGRGLGDIFNDIIVAEYTDNLCASGVLHAPKVYAGHSPDLRGVKKSMGDYSTSALVDRMNQTGLIGDIVETWKAKACLDGVGKKTVAFAVNVEHSQHIAAQFRDAGIRAEHIDGSTPKVERTATLARLRSGETQIVCNCMILTEGWDLPALECAIIARPTASLNLHLQMLGRIMRAADGKDGCIVLDHAGNHHMHGLVTRRIEYSLNGRIVGEKDPLGLRRCGACQLLFDPKLDACPECGWVPEKRETKIDSTPGVLGEFDEDFTYRREMYRLWASQAEDAGFKTGWVLYRYKERFGAWPVTACINGVTDLVDPANALPEEKKECFRQWSEFGAERGFKPGWAAHKYKDFFKVWPTGFVTEVRESLGVKKEAVDRADRLLAGVSSGAGQEEEEWLF